MRRVRRDLAGEWREVLGRVKSRVHISDAGAAVEPVDEVRRLRVGVKLAKALGKAAAHTRVVMIEINVPNQLKAVGTLERWPAAALKQIRDNEDLNGLGGEPFPPAYVFVTNHAFHKDLAGVGGSIQVLAAGFRMSDFGPDVRYESYAGVMAARDRHAPMTALIGSIRTHYEIPATFDGGLPRTFAEGADAVRFRFGERYMIPDADGGEHIGRLYNATVNPDTGEVHGAFELEDGRHVIARDVLDAHELAEYRRYPDTHFGEVLKPGGRCDTFVEICGFLFETYRHTPREKLLEFMAKAADIGQLRTLDQRDLAIAYAERMGSVIYTRADADDGGNRRVARAPQVLHYRQRPLDSDLSLNIRRNPRLAKVPPWGVPPPSRGGLELRDADPYKVPRSFRRLRLRSLCADLYLPRVVEESFTNEPIARPMLYCDLVELKGDTGGMIEFEEPVDGDGVAVHDDRVNRPSGYPLEGCQCSTFMCKQGR